MHAKNKRSVLLADFADRLGVPCLSGIFAALLVSPVVAGDWGLPARCKLGLDCFVQQYPDMDNGPDAIDPFCGTATYDGHDGTDLRVLSMKDISRGVPVLAMADGKVLRWRDGAPDQLALSEKERMAVESRECGNGVIINQGGGIETQYCHLRQGSVSVRDGDNVRKGDSIGEIGASGLVQFPHVHVTVRKNGRPLDPSTGIEVGDGCSGSASEPLFSGSVLNVLGRGQIQLLALGFSGAVIDHADLVVSGPPPQASRSSNAFVGWAWLQNLRKGDRIAVEVTDSAGAMLATTTTKPMDRTKASFSAYAGKTGAPRPGEYAVTVRLVRGGQIVFSRTERYTIG